MPERMRDPEVPALLVSALAVVVGLAMVVVSCRLGQVNR